MPFNNNLNPEADQTNVTKRIPREINNNGWTFIKNSDPLKKDKLVFFNELENIFGLSLPHYSLFFVWFCDNITKSGIPILKENQKATQTPLKLFSDNFAEVVTCFG